MYEFHALKYLVIRLWWVFVLAFAFAVTASASGIGGSSGVGGMPSSPVFSGTVSSTKPCETFYTRMGPNYCHLTGSNQSLTWTNAIACTAHAARVRPSEPRSETR